jgi:hypothetical protein
MQCQHRKTAFVARLPVAVELPKAVDGFVLRAPEIDFHLGLRSPMHTLSRFSVFN